MLTDYERDALNDTIIASHHLVDWEPSWTPEPAHAGDSWLLTINEAAQVQGVLRRDLDRWDRARQYLRDTRHHYRHDVWGSTADAR